MSWKKRTLNVTKRTEPSPLRCDPCSLKYSPFVSILPRIVTEYCIYLHDSRVQLTTSEQDIVSSIARGVCSVADILRRFEFWSHRNRAAAQPVAVEPKTPFSSRCAPIFGRSGSACPWFLWVFFFFMYLSTTSLKSRPSPNATVVSWLNAATTPFGWPKCRVSTVMRLRWLRK